MLPETRSDGTAMAIPQESIEVRATGDETSDTEGSDASTNKVYASSGSCRAWGATKSGAFGLTFFSYVMFHASRKSFSAIKGEMSAEQWIHSSVYTEDQQAQMYGLLDTLFMAAYAAGLYVSGVLGDIYDLRRIIASGMWLTAVIVLMFGLGAFAEIHALSFYAVLWGLNGLVQSCGWPANVAVMYVPTPDA
jgi:sugar phosphate permease